METLCKSFIIHLLKHTDFAEDEEQIEVYVYGLLSFVYTWIPLGILCVIAVCCGCFFEMLLWNLCFISFRNYAGGYHAPHPALCFVCSVLL